MIYPSTERAVFLAIFSEGSILKALQPSGGNPLYPGLVIDLVPRQILVEQFEQPFAAAAGPKASCGFEVCDFEEVLKDENDQAITLYLGRCRKADRGVDQLISIPELLRSMPSHRNRLAYLKAWQYLSGDHKLQTRAVEIDL